MNNKGKKIQYTLIRFQVIVYTWREKVPTLIHTAVVNSYVDATIPHI